MEQREREGILILDRKGALTLGYGDLQLRGDRLPAQLAKLAIAFEFFEDEQDSVNSFFADRAVRRRLRSAQTGAQYEPLHFVGGGLLK